MLVSDRPGEQDITHKNEDSKDLIQLKRSFFFKVLQKIIWQEQGLMSHGSNTLVMPCANSECETPEYIWQRAS